MNNKPLIITVVALAGLAVGCKPSNSADENPPASETNSTSSTIQTAKDYASAAMTNSVNATTQAWAEVKSSFQSAMGYSYDKKDEFVTKTSADIQALDQKIQDVSDRAANATDATKTDLQTKLEELRAKRAVLGQKLDDVKNATEANWDDAKTAFHSAYEDVRTSLKNAWSTLKGG